MTRLRKTVLKRATLKAERRWTGNQTETVTGDAVKMSDRKKIAIYLISRTCNICHLNDDKPLRSEICILTLEAYIKFGKTAVVFGMPTKADAQADVEILLSVWVLVLGPRGKVHLLNSKM